MTARCQDAPLALSRAVGAPAETRRGPRTLGAWLIRVWRVNAERRALARLDARQMRDMGISEEARAAELARAFWDIG